MTRLKWLLLFALLFAFALAQAGQERRPPILESGVVCHDGTMGTLRTTPAGAVLMDCWDGIYTEAQARTGRLWDEEE